MAYVAGSFLSSFSHAEWKEPCAGTQEGGFCCQLCQKAVSFPIPGPRPRYKLHSGRMT